MIIDGRHLDASAVPPSDVLVVGAGAVGLTLAIHLARAGRSVLLLEAGQAMVDQASQALIARSRSVGRPHSGLTQGRFRALGGTTNFWGGQLVPFDASIFDERPWLDAPNAWPITAADLEPFYSRVYDLLGMGRVIARDEDVAQRLGGSRPPLSPDLDYFYSRWAPEPNLAVHFGPELRRSRALTCLTGLQVCALKMEGDRVTGLEARRVGGESVWFAAPDIILANGTIEIARLLMAPLAGGASAPWSANPWLGRGFMDHLDVTAGRIRVRDRRAFSHAFENVVLDGIKYQPKIRLTPQAQRGRHVEVAGHLVLNDINAEHLRNAKIFVRGMLRGRFDRDVGRYPAALRALVTVGAPMIYRYLRANRIAINPDSEITLRVSAEQIMSAQSQIRLSSERDALGLPVVELDWRVDGRELQSIAHFARLVGRSLAQSQAAELEIDPRLAAENPAFLDLATDTNHQMGLARMGETPAAGVVDANLKVHGATNLHVAGAATFPSTGFANPTFTAMALGLRLGDRLLQKAP